MDRLTKVVSMVNQGILCRSEIFTKRGETYEGEKNTYRFFRGPSSKALELARFRAVGASSEDDLDWCRELLIVEENPKPLDAGESSRSNGSFIRNCVWYILS